MNNYLITNGDFFYFPEHDNSAADQDNPITREYLLTAMTNYLASLGLPPVAPAVVVTPTIAGGNSLQHFSLSYFWYSL